jgi:hypothetical protein
VEARRVIYGLRTGFLPGRHGAAAQAVLILHAGAGETGFRIEGKRRHAPTVRQDEIPTVEKSENDLVGLGGENWHQRRISVRRAYAIRGR